MPQLHFGGKYVYAYCNLAPSGRLSLPAQALAEYGLRAASDVILFSGSATSGGCCVTSAALLAASPLAHILRAHPSLAADGPASQQMVRAGAHLYCRAALDDAGALTLTAGTLAAFALAPLQRLLCIRSSNIAFSLAAQGPLLSRARTYAGDTPVV
nr:hypothetical protein [Maliibacterium massiliense]